MPDESTSGHRDKMRDLKHAGRHGSKLKATDPEAFERMRSILDYQGLPLHREASVGGSASVVPPPAQPADHVYINNLQTLRFLNFDPAYKAELARYKVASLNRELQPSLAKAQALLDHARKQRLEPQRNAAPVPFVVRSSTPPADKAQSDRKADK